MQIDLTPPSIQGPRKGLTIGIPNEFLPEKNMGRPTTVEWGVSLAIQNWPLNMQRWFHPIRGGGIDQGREIIAKLAQKDNSEFVFMLDDDTAPPSNAVRCLIDVMRQNPDAGIVTGVTPTKSDPVETNIFKEESGGCFWEWKEHEVFEIAECGAACWLIRMSVFDRLKEPYFTFVDDAAAKVLKDGTVQLGTRVSEDIGFCRRVREIGFKILCHGSVVCQHWNPWTGQLYTLPRNSFPYRK